MAMSHVEQEPSKGVLGRVNQAANIAATAHGIFQAAKWGCTRAAMTLPQGECDKQALTWPPATLYSYNNFNNTIWCTI